MNKIKDPRLKLQGLAKEQLVTEVQTRGAVALRGRTSCFSLGSGDSCTAECLANAKSSINICQRNKKPSRRRD